LVQLFTDILKIYYIVILHYITALGPSQAPIQCVPEALPLGVKWPGREADHSPSSSAEAKECMELYLGPQYAFMTWGSIESTGATLPFILYYILYGTM
jgi:hypothetical protein